MAVLTTKLPRASPLMLLFDRWRDVDLNKLQKRGPALTINAEIVTQREA